MRTGGRTRTESQPPGSRPSVARWVFCDSALLVDLTPRGVRSITLDREFNPAQQLLWEGVEIRVPVLDEVEPYGRRLAFELGQVAAGRSAEPCVPWVPDRPDWHVRLYRHVRQLPPGQLSDMSGKLELDGVIRDQRSIVRALRKCPLAPLVPLHRIRSIEVARIPFPWGKGWRDYLLRQEKEAGGAGDRGN